MERIIKEPTRSALRYYGGKWRIAQWIISHFPPHRVYIEPFGGSASVLMRKARSYAEIYNDLDGEVVNVFEVLRDPEKAAALEKLIKLTPYAREEYGRIWSRTEDCIEQARRTIAKAYFGYGSDTIFRKNCTAFRSDTDRKGTTVIRDWQTYPDNIITFSRRLQGVVIENRPAVDVIDQYDKEDALIYADPPYLKETRRHRYHGYRHEMSKSDHRRLAEVLHRVKGMVIISGYKNDMYDNDLYSDWRKVMKKTTNTNNLGVNEVLWISPNTPEQQPELFKIRDKI